MPTTLNPYLGFRDQARSAMDFYHAVFGGELTRSTFAEMHASEDPAEAEKVMHSQLVTPGGMVLMAADTPNSMEYSPGGPISVSLSGSDEAELRGYFERLSDGGTVVLPLEEAPWGDSFGMCRDRFGVSWMVNIGRSPT
jgi:PhnB protein